MKFLLPPSSTRCLHLFPGLSLYLFLSSRLLSRSSNPHRHLQLNCNLLSPLAYSSTGFSLPKISLPCISQFLGTPTSSKGPADTSSLVKPEWWLFVSRTLSTLP